MKCRKCSHDIVVKPGEGLPESRPPKPRQAPPTGPASTEPAVGSVKLRASGASALRVECPRCATKYSLSRKIVETKEAFKLKCRRCDYLMVAARPWPDPEF